MRSIWFALVLIVGLILFVLVEYHYIVAAIYVVIHMSMVAFAWYRKIFPAKWPKSAVAGITLFPQLVYCIVYHFGLESTVLEADVYDFNFKMNILRTGLLIVEFPMLVTFFNKPRLNRY